MQPKIIISEKEPPPPTGEPSFTPDSRQIEKLNLSKRELEVLILINEGLSNQQIADRLYVSENTIKKHISSIFLKMDVERRTEAIKKGKSMGILS
jgi:ATP/maltotriose-dependent transcriptional regulator MalT